MGVIRFENDYGERIVVKRDSDGRVMVSHSDFLEEGQFGEFIDAGILCQGQPLIGALVRFNGESFILNPDEAAAIREAAGRLTEPRHPGEPPNGDGAGR